MCEGRQPRSGCATVARRSETKALLAFGKPRGADVLLVKTLS